MAELTRSAGVGRVLYLDAGLKPEPEHERVSHCEAARRLAALQGLVYEGEYSPDTHYNGRTYFVPNGTLTSPGAARDLGITSEHDLFGGVVARPYMATKAVTHPLLNPNAAAPSDWCAGFAGQIAGSVLPGVTVFDLKEAWTAAVQLLRQGPVRIKVVLGKAGRGQFAVSDREDLKQALNQIDGDEVANFGLVLEAHLNDVVTYSVGTVHVGDLVASYYGTQSLTKDNSGESVYGGTEITVTRGGFGKLLDLDLSDAVRLAVRQGQVYDTAALESLPGFLGSRRNYDIAQGTDPRGKWHSGVLEQSWRIGGASCAEVAALEAFKDMPDVDIVQASSLERYGQESEVPPGANVVFQADDRDVGFITKCVMVERHDNKQHIH